MGWEKLSARGLAALLNPLGLYSNQVRQAEKIIRAYCLNVETLTELSERYAQNTAERDEKK